MLRFIGWKDWSLSGFVPVLQSLHYGYLFWPVSSCKKSLFSIKKPSWANVRNTEDFCLSNHIVQGGSYCGAGGFRGSKDCLGRRIRFLRKCWRVNASRIARGCKGICFQPLHIFYLCLLIFIAPLCLDFYLLVWWACYRANIWYTFFAKNRTMSRHYLCFSWSSHIRARGMMFCMKMGCIYQQPNIFVLFL